MKNGVESKGSKHAQSTNTRWKGELRLAACMACALHSHALFVTLTANMINCMCISLFCIVVSWANWLSYIFFILIYKENLPSHLWDLTSVNFSNKEDLSTIPEHLEIITC
jgi:hypothetical protein